MCDTVLMRLCASGILCDSTGAHGGTMTFTRRKLKFEICLCCVRRHSRTVNRLNTFNVAERIL